MWQVYRKELLELIRDRKTLIFVLALPMFLFPALFGGMAYLSGKMIKQEQEKVLSYAIFGAANAPDLVDGLNDDTKFKAVELADKASIEQAIRDEKIDFALVIANSFQQHIANNQQASVEIYLNDASAVSMTYRKVNEVVTEFNKQRSRNAFSAMGISEDQLKALLDPVTLDKKDVSDKRENIGEKIGGIIPYLVIILLLQGAMTSAVDLGAGEKERGTLETLLITPLTRTEIVLGKFMLIGTAGIVTAFVTVFSIVFWGTILSQGMAVKFLAEFMGAISILDFILMFLMLVPVAAIIGSTLLSLSIYARSFKEAQSYMGSLVFLFIIPIAVTLMPGVELKGVWAWIPITNVSLAIKELIKGTMDYWMLLSIFSSTFIIAGALLAFCVYWFKQEKVLFR